MISLTNIAKTILESHSDHGFANDYGFVDERNDDRTPTFDVLVTHSNIVGDDWGLVRKKNTKETYIIYLNDVPHEYYEGYYYWTNDDDPDFDDDLSWEDAYREFDDDTQLFERGIALYAEDLASDDVQVTTSVNEIIEANEKYILKITQENKAEVYGVFDDLIKAYLEPSYEERRNDKKGS
jgi:hypothetical protein